MYTQGLMTFMTEILMSSCWSKVAHLSENVVSTNIIGLCRGGGGRREEREGERGEGEREGGRRGRKGGREGGRKGERALTK